MGIYRLGVLRGDGIGPEVVEANVRVLEAAQQQDSRLRFEWVPLPMGWEAIRATGSALSDFDKKSHRSPSGEWWIVAVPDVAGYFPGTGGLPFVDRDVLTDILNRLIADLGNQVDFVSAPFKRPATRRLNFI